MIHQLTTQFCILSILFKVKNGEIIRRRTLYPVCRVIHFLRSRINILISPLLGTLTIRGKGEAGLPCKDRDSERGSGKGQPAGHQGRWHFLRRVNLRTNNTEDLRI